MAWLRLCRGTNYQRYYLKSRLWREVIRRQVMNRDDCLCAVCGDAAKHIHHLSYDEETLLGRNLSNLQSVCLIHHNASHDGNPAYETAQLTKRFGEVKSEYRREKKMRTEFESVGGKMLVTAKLYRGWWTCKFAWEFDEKYENIADFSDCFFTSAAKNALKLERPSRRPGQVGGARFYPRRGGDHCVILFLVDWPASPGTIKLRASRYPDWVKSVRALTSRHPFPIEIVDAKTGECAARSGGYVGPKR